MKIMICIAQMVQQEYGKLGFILGGIMDYYIDTMALAIPGDMIGIFTETWSKS